jgi:hypothetical protein
MGLNQNSAKSLHVNFDKVATRLSRTKTQTLYHFGSGVRHTNRRGGLIIRTEQARLMVVSVAIMASLEKDGLIWTNTGKAGLTRLGLEVAAVLRNREAALREASQHMEAAE